MTPARLVFPVLRWGSRAPDEVWPDVRAALDLGVGGFVVFGGSMIAMKELVGRALEHAGRPVLFAADLERGAGQQLEGATPLPPPAALASLTDRGLLEAARMTAQEAASAGIGWVLAPMADLDVEPANPIVGTRSFGADPAAVAHVVRVWVRTAQDEGVHACAKHFPGHGRTTADSHAELPVVGATRGDLDADLTPFRAAIEAGVRTIMMAHVVYPHLDPSGAPASLSPPIYRLLRDELGFNGVIASDALIMHAISAAGRSEAEAAVEAVRAGCDALLYPTSADEAVAALSAALDSGALERARVSEAVGRVERLATEARIELDDPVPEPSIAQALELAAASVLPVRGMLPRWWPGQSLRVHVIDDDVVSLPDWLSVPASPPRDRAELSRALERRAARVEDPSYGGPAVDLIAIFSEVRGWKGRAELAPETVSEALKIIEKAPEAAVVLFGHPRLADQLPSAATVVCAWCGDPLMQDAVAERLIVTPN
ncbi:MAG: hypothetical protein JSV41_12430 [Gemmatimonadota bacterium]|nr:MAG: hypothetical protein JSV41_12430 [Gemmatimonadota bacterium]